MPKEGHVLEGGLLPEGLKEVHRNLDLARIDCGAVELEELLSEVPGAALEVPNVILREACEDPIPEARRGPILGPRDDLAEGQGGPGDGHLLAGRHDAPQDLDLMRPLIFILVLVPPEAHFHLCRMGGALGEDPPTMAMMDCIM